MNKVFDLYLKESDLAEATKVSYLYDYNNFIEIYEQAKNKGLENFNEDDVIEIINTMPTSSWAVKYKMYKMIDQFQEWALSRGFNHSYNPCNNIDFNNIVEINRSILESKQISLEECFDICNVAIDDDSIDYQHIVPFLLCRYGLKGKEWSEIRYLRDEDIDYDNCIINVTNRDSDEFDESQLEIIKRVRVDKRLIKYIEEAKNTHSFVRNSRKDYIDGSYNTKGFLEFEYLDFGYICKSTSKSDSVVLSNSALRNRIVAIFSAIGINRISMKDLVKSRKIDMLNRVLEYKRVHFANDFKKMPLRYDLNLLTNFDFIAVQEYYEVNASQSSYFALKKDYEGLYGKENILLMNKKGFMELDKVRQLVKKIIEDEV